MSGIAGSFASAVEENARALDTASVPELRELGRAIAEAENETASLVLESLKAAEAGWEARRARGLLLQLTRASEQIKRRLGEAAVKDLERGGRRAIDTAARHAQRMMDAGMGEHVAARFDVARVLADTKRMVWPRFASSAKRYAGDVGDAVRRKMLVGIVRGEGVDELASRVLKGTGLIRHLKERGDLSAMADASADATFSTARSWAERLVHTEQVNAYGAAAQEAIVDANRTDPGWVKKWDAANDRRVCVDCSYMDGTIVDDEAAFSSRRRGKCDHPPLHPWCRCCVVPWRRDWKF